MEFLSDPDFWQRGLRMVFTDLAPAGDNAVVIASSALGCRGTRSRAASPEAT